MAHVFVSVSWHNWFRRHQCLLLSYLWYIQDCEKRIHWNLNQNWTRCVQQNVLENLVCKHRSFTPQCLISFRLVLALCITVTSQERQAVSNHQLFDCLCNRKCGPTWNKYLSPHYWPFVRKIHRWPVNSSYKGPVSREMLPYDDVIIGVYQLARIRE